METSNPEEETLLAHDGQDVVLDGGMTWRGTAGHNAPTWRLQALGGGVARECAAALPAARLPPPHTHRTDSILNAATPANAKKQLRESHINNFAITTLSSVLTSSACN